MHISFLNDEHTGDVSESRGSKPYRSAFSYASKHGGDGNKGLYDLFRCYGTLKTFNKQAMIFRKGDPAKNVYLIEKGLIKICQMTYSGQDVTFFIRRSGEYFGMAEIILQQSHPCYAQCLCESRIWVLQSDVIKEKIKTDSAITSALLVTLTARLMHEEQIVEQLVSKSVSARVAWLINQLYLQQPQRSKSDPIILTHQEMSHLVGCSRQSLSEVLNEWRSRGIIRYDRKQMLVLKPNDLAQYS
ncbi:Crp/Fnr family transcriptional regulator [Sporolactobacillus shoreicorticis]|uniref:Crp/Fnr family transcriptional regulator n=1 Tax=Sporolactobacillus shoreicorticis TaxID=1923877 RepID=A0ABW5S704_9BACL|nr:Crp/Fnr family transcriptional regulator [Sporolactobacillus shoreicorticis]MCO7125487.1 Crp/Fnr family transcriptional regulator [Sporolactobacillus shoreicorticis]